jgi:hypothetical protein
MFIAALCTTAKLWKQPRCPTTDEWIKKLYLYTMEFHSATRKNETMWFKGKWILDNTILSEVSQDQKAKDRIFSLMCGIETQYKYKQYHEK